MAIDSAEKRKSAAGSYRVGVKGVTPNASKDAEWRQQAQHRYSGVAATTPPDSKLLGNGLGLSISLGTK